MTDKNIVPHSLPTGNRVSTILQEFGVPFEKRDGRHTGFWRRNEGKLEYILNDFRRVARELKSRLHPDRKGDSDAFATLSAKCDYVERRFAAHLYGSGNNLDIASKKERDRATIIAKAIQWRNSPAGKACKRRAEANRKQKRQMQRERFKATHILQYDRGVRISVAKVGKYWVNRHGHRFGEVSDLALPVKPIKRIDNK